MKTFDEVFNEIKSNVSVSKSGKVKKTFSKTDFDKLLKAFMNTPDYEMQVAGTKGGEMVTKTVYPVKEFRKFVEKVLADFGVDAQERKKMESEYDFSNPDAFYYFMSEFLMVYMSAGKKFDFPTKEDFSGSISLKDVAESVGTYKPIGKNSEGKDPFKIKTGAHKILEKKSKAPKWLKKKFN